MIIYDEFFSSLAAAPRTSASDSPRIETNEENFLGLLGHGCRVRIYCSVLAIQVDSCIFHVMWMWMQTLFCVQLVVFSWCSHTANVKLKKFFTFAQCFWHFARTSERLIDNKEQRLTRFVPIWSKKNVPRDFSLLECVFIAATLGNRDFVFPHFASMSSVALWIWFLMPWQRHSSQVNSIRHETTRCFVADIPRIAWIMQLQSADRHCLSRILINPMETATIPRTFCPSRRKFGRAID